MNKEARKVNVIYEELRGRLTYPLLLYVPKNYFENLLQNEQLIQLDWVFDVLIMVKHELDVVFIDDKDESHEVLKKTRGFRGKFIRFSRLPNRIKTSTIFIFNKEVQRLFICDALYGRINDE
jgi:hypothetical protein